MEGELNRLITLFLIQLIIIFSSCNNKDAPADVPISFDIFSGNGDGVWFENETPIYTVEVYSASSSLSITVTVLDDNYNSINYPSSTQSISAGSYKTWTINKSHIDAGDLYYVEASFYDAGKQTTRIDHADLIYKAGDRPSGQEPATITYNPEAPISYSPSTDNKYQITLEIDMGSLPLDERYLIRSNLTDNEDGTNYEFNDASILYDESNPTFTFVKEYGGSLPAGEYRLTSMLKVDETSIMASASEQAVTVNDLSSDHYTKLITIEYDCHAGQNFYGNYTDMVKNFSKQAFDPTTFSLLYQTDETNLIVDNSDIPSMDDDWIRLNSAMDFAMDHDRDKPGDDVSPHLLFLGYPTDESGTVNKNVRGYAQYDPITTYMFTYVFLYNHWENDVLEVETVIKTIIHEFGHGIGDLRHASGSSAVPGNHDSPYCVMNQGPYYHYEGTDNDNNLDNNSFSPQWWFLQNPHFCDKCIENIISNNKWGTDT